MFKTGLGSKILFGVSVALAVPVAAVAGLLLLPISVPALIGVKIQDVQGLRMYNEKKATIMARWTKSHLKQLLTYHNIYNYISMAYFEYLQKQIIEICDMRIPAIIASDKLMIQQIQSDQRTSTEILQELQPVQQSLDFICSQIRFYDMRHYDREFNFVSLESITLCGEIGAGQFSTEYRVTLKHKNIPPREATLKIMKYLHEEGKALDEVACLRYVI